MRLPLWGCPGAQAAFRLAVPQALALGVAGVFGLVPIARSIASAAPAKVLS